MDYAALYQQCSLPEKRRLEALVFPERWQGYWEAPVDIVTFIDHPDYLNLAGQIWPVVYDDLQKIFSGGYNEVVMLCGIGAAKSTTTALINCYVAYRLLCLIDPISYYNKTRGTLLSIVNTATTASQAHDIVFGRTQKIIDASPWFQANAQINDKIRSRIEFKKGVMIMPGNSSDTRVLGYDIFCCVMDEAAFMRQPGISSGRQTKDQAETMHNALSSRRSSRFGNDGYVMVITSPQYEGDFGERKYLEARSNPRIYAVRRATWEAKPATWKGEVIYCGQTFRDSELGIDVPIEHKKDWDRNPHAARRDFAARPSSALNPFMDADKLRDIMAASRMACPVERFDGMGYPLQYFNWFRPTGAAYYIHVDLGLSRDACGFALGHWDRTASKCVIDLAIEIRTSEKKHLDFEAVRGLIFKLKDMGYYIAKVSYDNYQSTDSLQILRSKGFDCEELSTVRTLEPYDTLLDFVNTGRLDTYQNDDLLSECARLELIDGKKVDHPANGKKDIADAVAGVCYWIGQQIKGGAKQRVVMGVKSMGMVIGR